MKQICKFNKDRDLKEVVPGLAPNLKIAMSEHVVLDTGVSPDYNNIDDPANIVGRVRDVFDAVEAQRALVSSMKSQNTNTSPAGESVSGENE